MLFKIEVCVRENLPGERKKHEQTASRRATHWFGLTYVYILYLFTEYAGNIGDAKDPETRELEQDHIMQLVDKF